MKALTLTQPWATLMAYGHKRIETRSWTTSYRGVVAIHAAKGFPADVRLLCSDVPFSTGIRAAGYESARDLPTGAILAVGELAHIARIPRDGTYHFRDYQMHHGIVVRNWVFDLPAAEPERSFGDYTPGRYAWFFVNVRRLRTPVPCKGALSLWEVQDLCGRVYHEAMEPAPEGKGATHV